MLHMRTQKPSFYSLSEKWCHRMPCKCLGNTAVCLWENESEKGKWRFSVMMKTVLPSQTPWNGLRELQFLDQLWEPLPYRKCQHHISKRMFIAALYVTVKPKNNPKSIIRMFILWTTTQLEKGINYSIVILDKTNDSWATQASHGQIYSAFIPKVLVRDTF